MGLNLQLVAIISDMYTSHSELLVGLEDNGDRGIREVNFHIQPLESKGKIITLTQCQNDPYELQGTEKDNFSRKWQQLCDIAQEEGFSDPFQYITSGRLDNYAENLPNAITIISGFFKYVKAFQEKNASITHVGRTIEGVPKPLNQPVINRLTELTHNFYTGNAAEDAEPTLF